MTMIMTSIISFNTYVLFVDTIRCYDTIPLTVPSVQGP